jgi:hypothetical protein
MLSAWTTSRGAGTAPLLSSAPPTPNIWPPHVAMRTILGGICDGGAGYLPCKEPARKRGLSTRETIRCLKSYVGGKLSSLLAYTLSISMGANIVCGPVLTTRTA